MILAEFNCFQRLWGVEPFEWMTKHRVSIDNTRISLQTVLVLAVFSCRSARPDKDLRIVTAVSIHLSGLSAPYLW